MLVDGRVTGEIGLGLVVLLGIAKGDTSDAARYLADKTATLRIFADEAGKMNLSLVDVHGAALVVYNSPSTATPGDSAGQASMRAAPPDQAKQLYADYCAALRGFGVSIRTGIFQTMMSVELTNDGPVTDPPGLRKAVLIFC